MLFNSSSESVLSTTSDGSPLKLKTKKRVSNSKRKALTNSNSAGNSLKSKLFHAGGRENKTPSSRVLVAGKTPYEKGFSISSISDKDKGRKIRRKSGVLSKKPGVKDATSRFLMTPHRTVLRTPGSGFTPPRMGSSQATHKNTLISNKKTVNVENKQRKRKLHNPSTLPAFLS